MVEATGLRFAPSLLSVMLSAFEGRAEGVNFEPRLIYIQVRERERRVSKGVGGEKRGDGEEQEEEEKKLSSTSFAFSSLTPSSRVFLLKKNKKTHHLSRWARMPNRRE